MSLVTILGHLDAFFISGAHHVNCVPLFLMNRILMSFLETVNSLQFNKMRNLSISARHFKTEKLCLLFRSDCLWSALRYFMYTEEKRSKTLPRRVQKKNGIVSKMQRRTCSVPLFSRNIANPLNFKYTRARVIDLASYLRDEFTSLAMQLGISE